MATILLISGLLSAYVPTLRPSIHSCTSRPAARHQITACNARGMSPRCRIVAALEDTGQKLDDEQISTIFKEFDTSGDGFIDLDELQSALTKAGKQVTKEQAQTILSQVDANNDGQISLDEFKAVFKLAPDDVPAALKPLTGVSSFFLDSLLNVGEALGIEVRGQWRTTQYGSRYVDDVLGSGNLVTPGDIVTIHYTITLLTTGKVVESSRNGAPPSFELGEPRGDAQNWDDAIAGMRVGGQRRVYANPAEGQDGPTAKYDIEILNAEEATPPTVPEQIITSLGGRRAAARLLFAATFVPYFLPEKFQPAFFRSDGDSSSQLFKDDDGDGLVAKPTVDRVDQGVASRLDALFAQEELPKKAAK